MSNSASDVISTMDAKISKRRASVYYMAQQLDDEEFDEFLAWVLVEGSSRHKAKSPTSGRIDGIAPMKRWYLRKTTREAVCDVMADGLHRGSGDIFRATKKMIPGVKRSSLFATVHQLKLAGVIEKAAEGPHGAIYKSAKLEKSPAH